MAFSDFLNHKCDIYHIKKTDRSPGYGLPVSPVFSYPDTPDISELECRFSTRSGSVGGLRVRQNQPNAVLAGLTKLAVPLGTDIRLNDKIYHHESGIEYTAEKPVQIQNHHIIAILRRTSQQESL